MFKDLIYLLYSESVWNLKKFKLTVEFRIAIWMLQCDWMLGFDVFYIDHAHISSTTTTHTGNKYIVCLADIVIRGIGSIFLKSSPFYN